jgi:hypothetical protein
MKKKKKSEENLLVTILSCGLAIIGVVMMRVVLKLDYQSWSLFYLAAACTAAIRWTSVGATLSVGSAFRAGACLMIGLFAIKFAGYPGASSFQTASLIPHEIMDALSHFHVLYE